MGHMRVKGQIKEKHICKLLTLLFGGTTHGRGVGENEPVSLIYHRRLTTAAEETPCDI